jgi:uncharacterized membrane protein YhaH (DUF805 family)
MGIFSFSGRAGRLAYWGITLLATCIFLGIGVALPESDVERAEVSMVSLTAAIFGLIIGVWLSLAVTVRRFHDRGKSGLWYFALLIPIIGLWFMIELAFFGGTEEINEYGSL